MVAGIQQCHLRIAHEIFEQEGGNVYDIPGGSALFFFHACEAIWFFMMPVFYLLKMRLACYSLVLLCFFFFLRDGFSAYCYSFRFILEHILRFFRIVTLASLCNVEESAESILASSLLFIFVLESQPSTIPLNARIPSLLCK